MKRSISLSFTILLLINCIITCPAFAQSVASNPQPPIQSPTADDKPGGSRAPALNGSLLSSTFSDTAKVLKSPAHWNTSDWLRASAIAGTAFGLYSLDGSVRNWAQDHRSKTTDQIANYVRPFGDPSYTMPALGAVYLGAEYFKNEKLRNTATLGLESLFVTGLFVEGLKRVGHRVRPDDTTSSGDWNGPSLTGKGDSFPSGHSASAFALATVIATEYKDNKYIPPLAYSLATMTALSRVNDNVHWGSDIFIGSALGYFTAKAIMRLHPGMKSQSTTVAPIISGDEMGVNVSHSF